MHNTRYTVLVRAVEDRPTMAPGLRAAVHVTAANAQYLLDRANQDNDPSLVHGAVVLFDAADQIVWDWDADPGKWTS